MSYGTNKEWNDDMEAGEAAMQAADKERREGTFLTAEQVKKLTDLLEGIGSPLAKLERDAEAQGLVLNGMAVRVAYDPSLLKEWAREALKVLNAAVSKRHYP